MLPFAELRLNKIIIAFNLREVGICMGYRTVLHHGFFYSISKTSWCTRITISVFDYDFFSIFIFTHSLFRYVAVFMSDDYARLSKKLDFDLAMTVVRGGKKTERFLILVKSDSPYHNLQDLRNRNLSLAKGDSLGLLYLDVLLLKHKLPAAAKYFSLLNETARPSQAILAVFFGQSDLCVVNEISYDLVSELNPQVKARLRSVGASPEYVLGVGIFRKNMPAEQRKILENALLNIGDSPRGKQVLTLFKTERFAPIQPGELESVRQLIRENDALRVRK